MSVGATAEPAQLTVASKAPEELCLLDLSPLVSCLQCLCQAGLADPRHGLVPAVLLCPHHPWGRLGSLSSDCLRIPACPGHCRALLGMKRFVVRTMSWTEHRPFAQHLQNLQVAPAQPWHGSRADGGQLGLWTPHLEDTTLGRFGEFYAKCEHLQTVPEHIVTQCPGGTCSQFVGRDTAPQSAQAMFASVGLTSDPTPPCSFASPWDGCGSLLMASARGWGQAGTGIALQRGASYLQNLQAVEARESFPWDPGDLVSREASAVKRRASPVSTSL